MQREVREILTEEQLVGERCNEVDIRKDGKRVRDITKVLKNTLTQNKLHALSAPAIGYNDRIFCISFSDLEIKTFINPIIVNAKGLQLSKETSYFFPDRTFIRPRNTEINIMYQRPMGQIESRKITGYSAIVFQQMVDELDGLYLPDVSLEIDDDFEKATDEEKQEVIAAYLDSLDLKKQEIEKEIEEDPDLKELSDGVAFMESVARGEVEFMSIPSDDNEGDIDGVHTETQN